MIVRVSKERGKSLPLFNLKLNIMRTQEDELRDKLKSINQRIIKGERLLTELKGDRSRIINYLNNIH
tara:strand:- start:1072 stop:1272 length:201 start_codon:yes stop_codon:yes gene_type:complete